MPSRLSSKAAKIMIVEALSARRMMMMEYFRKAGWTGVTSSANNKDALAIIEADPVPPDWIIVPLNDASTVNGAQILALAVNQEKLKNTRVSLILDSESEFVLPGAFAMGLLSFHIKSPATDVQMNSILEVALIGETVGWNEVYISAAFLRRTLINNSQFSDLVALERRIFSMYPDQSDLLLKLAEAFIFAGKSQEALALLTRAKGMSASLDGKVAELMTKANMSFGGSSCSVQSIGERLDLKTAVLVDPDEASSKQVSETLKTLGISSIHCFADGASAWAWLSANSEPDLIIQEWRIPKVSGDQLIQRVRQHGFRNCTVIVYSSLVKSSDRMLLREMGVSDVIEKPQSAVRFGPMLTTLLIQDRKPEDEKVLERKVRQAFEAKNHQESKLHFDALCAKPSTSDGLKKSLGAEFAFNEGRIQVAKKMAVESMQILGEDVFSLNLLGKIHHKLGQHHQAAKYFARASELSPKNIERVCRLAEVQIDAGNQMAASEALNTALKLDSNNIMVRETDVKVALASGDSERVNGMMSEAVDNSRLVAFMNNRAVALVAEKKLGEANKLYLTALKALPKKLQHLAPIIQYNLALASVRSGNLANAITYLSAANKSKDGGSMQKIRSLLDRASTAPIGDAGVDSDVKEEIVEVVEGLPVKAGCKSGDLCCHLVFQPSRAVDARFLLMLANGPRFRDRKVSIGYDKAAS